MVKHLIDLPKGVKLNIFDIAGSTNEEAKKLAANGADGWNIVWAKTQTNGKGRAGKNWISPLGNLYFSLLLWPEKKLQELHQLSFVAALVLEKALKEFLPKGSEVSFKWPNDILVDSKKIAGILLESGANSKGRWLVIGIGVNVESFPENVDYPATSLANKDALKYSVEEILEKIIIVFKKEIADWQDNGFVHKREQWLSKASGINRPILVKLPQGNEDGVMHGIDEDGCLLIEQKNGTLKKLSGGQLFFMDGDYAAHD